MQLPNGLLNPMIRHCPAASLSFIITCISLSLCLLCEISSFCLPPCCLLPLDHLHTQISRRAHLLSGSIASMGFLMSTASFRLLEVLSRTWPFPHPFHKHFPSFPLLSASTPGPLDPADANLSQRMQMAVGKCDCLSCPDSHLLLCAFQLSAWPHHCNALLLVLGPSSNAGPCAITFLPLP